MNIGQYRNTNYTFLTGTRTVTLYGVTDYLSLRNLQLFTIQRNDGNSYPAFIAPTATYANVSYAKPASACVAGTPTSGGSITSGTHSYIVTYVINGYETVGSVKSNVVDTTTDKTVDLSSIPVGPTGTTARKIYRTNAGDTGNYYLITTINDNTTTTFSDTTADNTTTAAPLTSYCYDLIWNSTINNVSTPTTTSGDEFIINISIKDLTIDENLEVQNISNNTPEWSHYTDQNEIVDYSNQAAGIVRHVISTKTFNKLKLALSYSTGAGNTIEIRLKSPAKSTCVDTDSVNWSDITQDVLGVPYINVIASTTATNKNYYFSDICEERLMVEITFANDGTPLNTLTLSERRA